MASGRKIYRLPVSEGGIDLKTADIKDLLEVYGLQGIAQKSAVKSAQPHQLRNRFSDDS